MKDVIKFIFVWWIFYLYKKNIYLFILILFYYFFHAHFRSTYPRTLPAFPRPPRPRGFGKIFRPRDFGRTSRPQNFGKISESQNFGKIFVLSWKKNMQFFSHVFMKIFYIIAVWFNNWGYHIEYDLNYIFTGINVILSLNIHHYFFYLNNDHFISKKW